MFLTTNYDNFKSNNSTLCKNSSSISSVKNTNKNNNFLTVNFNNDINEKNHPLISKKLLNSTGNITLNQENYDKTFKTK